MLPIYSKLQTASENAANPYEKYFLVLNQGVKIMATTEGTTHIFI